jgi:uncharacterized membrane protein YgcG
MLAIWGGYTLLYYAAEMVKRPGGQKLGSIGYYATGIVSLGAPSGTGTSGGQGGGTSAQSGGGRQSSGGQGSSGSQPGRGTKGGRA